MVLKIGGQELAVFYSLGEGVFKNGRDILGWSQGTGRQRDNCTSGVGHSGWDIMSGASDELGGRGWGGVVWNGDLCSQEWPEVAAKIFLSQEIFFYEIHFSII